jgi:hypothetical protein
MAKRLDRRLEMRAAVRNANWRRLGAEQKAEKPPIGEEEAACWLSVFGVGGRRLLIMVAHPPELLVARGEPTFRSGYAELSALICAGVLLTAIERTFGFNYFSIFCSISTSISGSSLAKLWRCHHWGLCSMKTAAQHLPPNCVADVLDCVSNWERRQFSTV